MVVQVQDREHSAGDWKWVLPRDDGFWVHLNLSIFLAPATHRLTETLFDGFKKKLWVWVPSHFSFNLPHSPSLSLLNISSTWLGWV